MRFPLIVIVVVFTFFACRKEPDILPVKSYEKFETQFLANFKPIRLFANKMEITNPAVVNSYVQRHDQYFYDKSSKVNDDNFKSFIWINNDSILNVGIVPVAELKRKSTGVYDKFSSKYTMPVNDTNALFLHISQYKMYELATTPLGYTYAEYETPAYVVKRVNDTLFFPTIRYIVTSITDNTFLFTADRINNVFNPAVLNKLGAKDTLIVQEFDLGLKK